MYGLEGGSLKGSFCSLIMRRLIVRWTISFALLNFGEEVFFFWCSFNFSIVGWVCFFFFPQLYYFSSAQVS